MNGKTIRLYLVDGVPNGTLTAEIINWTGKVVVAPRSNLDSLALRAEVKRTGVYLLVGPDPESPSRELVYVGEGDNVLARLLKHNKDVTKDFWTRTAVVISKDDNLTKAHVRYLESQLIGKVNASRRARLHNGTEPLFDQIPESDKADMHFFLEQLQMVLPVLGFNFTQPLPTAESEAASAVQSPLFVMTPVGTAATARELDGEFVVLKGSTARKQGVESWTSYRGLRDQLVSEGKLVTAAQDGYFVFSEDVPFASPSAAAAVVYGGNQNGRKAWRTRDGGLLYEDWVEQKLATAGGVTSVEGLTEDEE